MNSHDPPTPTQKRRNFLPPSSPSLPLSSSPSRPPPPFSSSPPPPSSDSPLLLQPGKSGGQSLDSAHDFGALLPGRWGASPAISFLMETLYGCFGSPFVATGVPSASKPWM